MPKPDSSEALRREFYEPCWPNLFSAGDRVVSSLKGVIGPGERLNLAEILSRRDREDFGFLENFLQACLMLEIFLIVMGIFIPLGMMARKARKRRNSGFVAIPFDDDLALGALASNAVVLGGVFGANLLEDLYVISADLTAVVTDLTAGQGDQLTIGFSHEDYSAAEVAENLNVQLLGPGSKIEQEQARRLVRRTGSMMPIDQAATQAKMIGRDGSHLTRTKLKFVVQSGHDLDIWVMNRSGAALTTGATVKFSGTVYGRWIL